MARKKIVAVFGSSNFRERSSKAYRDAVLKMATRLGKLLSMKWIVLTGGQGGQSAGESVKENAIKGAMPNTWIGVTQSGCKQFCGNLNYCVIHTDLGDARNYVEACLCDAAIILPGEDGTKSEAIFTLACGKLIVFAGPWDPGVISNFKTEEGLRKQLEKSIDHVTQRRPDLREFITHKGFAGANPDRMIIEPDIENVCGSLESRGLQVCGEFPDLPGYSHIQTAYKAWLSAVGAQDPMVNA